ncbi:hypothetical protein Afe04nite_33160 [Asanoa ferruginea]|nr:hypothetical protein Afe04nite_33160 [Asanoa ferruginea]
MRAGHRHGRGPALVVPDRADAELSGGVESPRFSLAAALAAATAMTATAMTATAMTATAMTAATAMATAAGWRRRRRRAEHCRQGDQRPDNHGGELSPPYEICSHMDSPRECESGLTT